MCVCARGACCVDREDKEGQKRRVSHQTLPSLTPGLVILARNWLEVYRGWEGWHAATLPNLQAGQPFVPTALTMERGRTEAPPLLSEADLIAVSA